MQALQLTAATPGQNIRPVTRKSIIVDLRGRPFEVALTAERHPVQREFPPRAGFVTALDAPGKGPGESLALTATMDLPSARRWGRRRAKAIGATRCGREVMGYLASMPSARRSGWAWPTLDTIADGVGYSRAAVCTALTRIEAGGEIQRVRSPGRRATKYRVVHWQAADPVPEPAAKRPALRVVKKADPPPSRPPPSRPAEPPPPSRPPPSWRDPAIRMNYGHILRRSGRGTADWKDPEAAVRGDVGLWLDEQPGLSAGAIEHVLDAVGAARAARQDLRVRHVREFLEAAKLTA